MRTKFENTEVFNFNGAIRGCRNPKNSWARSDSHFNPDGTYYLGPNDLDLACRLISGGSEHRKFLRMITVCVDITAPRYWWQEEATYKIGTCENSTSTMHKLGDHRLTEDDFENGLDKGILEIVNKYWDEYKANPTVENLHLCKIQLPESFLNKRTLHCNYETIMTMFKQRKNHRLPHWRVDFCKWALTLPYMREFLIAAKIIDEDYEPKE